MTRRAPGMFRNMSACALLALAAGVCLAQAPEHQAPVENLAASKSVDTQARTEATLQEMWQRRILSTESRQWSSEDLDLLQRMREAERYGAVTLLRKRVGDVSGLTFGARTSPSAPPVLKLTREGYERWVTLRSQEAIDYFEQKGVETKWIFFLVDLDGHRLFDGGGRLTPRGEYVYDLASVNMPVWWRVPQTGEVFGTRPPPQR